MLRYRQDEKRAFYRELPHFRNAAEGKEDLTLTAEKTINMTHLVRKGA